MKDHLSASQINEYLKCPRKYCYHHIEEIPVLFKSASLAFGSAIHSALAFLMQEKMNNNGVDLKKLLSIFRADWEAQKCGEIKFSNGENEVEYLEKGVSLLKLAFEEFKGVKVKAVEFQFKAPLFDLETGQEIIPIPVEGFIDLIIEPDIIVEFKTGVRKWDETALKTNIQLSLYHYAYSVLYGRAPSLQVTLLLKQKTPKIEHYQPTRSSQEIRWSLNLIKEVYESIQKESFYPNPAWWCSDCEYAELCQRESVALPQRAEVVNF